MVETKSRIKFCIIFSNPIFKSMIYLYKISFENVYYYVFCDISILSFLCLIYTFHSFKFKRNNIISY